MHPVAAVAVLAFLSSTTLPENGVPASWSPLPACRPGLMSLALATREAAMRPNARATHDDAANAFLDWVASCPNHREVPQALFEAGVALERAMRYASAAAVYERAASRFTDRERVQSALFREAFCQFRAFDPEGAVATYERVIQLGP